MTALMNKVSQKSSTELVRVRLNVGRLKSPLTMICPYLGIRLMRRMSVCFSIIAQVRLNSQCAFARTASRNYFLSSKLKTCFLANHFTSIFPCSGMRGLMTFCTYLGKRCPSPIRCIIDHHVHAVDVLLLGIVIHHPLAVDRDKQSFSIP